MVSDQAFPPKQVAYYGWIEGGWQRSEYQGELTAFLEAVPLDYKPNMTQARHMFEDATNTVWAAGTINCR